MHALVAVYNNVHKGLRYWKCLNSGSPRSWEIKLQPTFERFQVLTVESINMIVSWDDMCSLVETDWWWKCYAPLKPQPTSTRLYETTSQMTDIFHNPHGHISEPTNIICFERSVISNGVASSQPAPVKGRINVKEAYKFAYKKFSVKICT